MQPFSSTEQHVCVQVKVTRAFFTQTQRYKFKFKLRHVGGK